jgi:hypothetical protein
MNIILTSYFKFLAASGEFFLGSDRVDSVNDTFAMTFFLTVSYSTLNGTGSPVSFDNRLVSSSDNKYNKYNSFLVSNNSRTRSFTPIKLNIIIITTQTDRVTYVYKEFSQKAVNHEF